ncbi:MAG: hypothetical protein OEM52_09705 [bacterium]|nr:hypothetical protein [bacterium]
MNYLAKPIRIIVDLGCLMAAYGGAYLLRYESGLFTVNVRGDFLAASLLLSVSWLIVFLVLGHYSGHPVLPLLTNMKKVAVVVLIGGLTLFWLTFEAERPLPSGRFVLLAYGVGIILLVPLGRTALIALQRSRWRAGHDRCRTILVGHGRWIKLLSEEFTNHPEFGHEYIGNVRLTPETVKDSPRELGLFEQLGAILSNHRIECVILAWEHEHSEEVLEGIMIANHANAVVQVVPDLRDYAASWARLQARDDLPLFMVNADFHPQWERMLKGAVGGNNA